MPSAHCSTAVRGSSATVDRFRNDRGFVLILGAILAIPLFLAVGFATDVGAWYQRGSQLQKMADAASLAGVVWLPDETRALAVSCDTLNRNGLGDTDCDGISNTDPNITWSANVGYMSTQWYVQVIDLEADLFFTGMVLTNVDIHRAALAEYAKPVELGSPSSSLGDGLDNVVLTMTGPWEDKHINAVYDARCNNAPRYLAETEEGGSAVAWNYTCPSRSQTAEVFTLFGGTDYDGTFEPETFVSATNSEENPSYRHGAYDVVTGVPRAIINQGYLYAVEVPAEATAHGSATVTIEVVHAGMPGNADLNNANDCGVASPADSEGCNNSIRECLEADGYARAPQDGGVGGSECSGHTQIFQVFGPDNTQISHRDNPLLSANSVGASPSCYSGGAAAGTPVGTTRGSSGSGDTLTLLPDDTGSWHGDSPITGRWMELCTLRVPKGWSGVIPVSTRHDSWGTGSGSSNWGIRACIDGFGTCPGTGVAPQVFGVDDMNVRFTAVEGDRALFYLAKIESAHAGKTVVLRLFDAGDAPDDNGHSTQDLSVLGPDIDWSSVGGVDTSRFAPCGWSSWMETQSFPSAEGWGPDGPTQVPPGQDAGGDGFAAECTIRTDTTQNVGIFDGMWLEVRVQLPADYLCDSEALPPSDPTVTSESCWWQVLYEPDGDPHNEPYVMSDRLVVEAQVIGDPVRLIE